jgi:hypothetical protein
MGRDFRHAWRGVRARGWWGALVVSLLAVTLAANTVVFSAADAFLLRRVPYPDASRLIELGEQGTFGWTGAILPETVPARRAQADLFSTFQAYLKTGGRAFVTGGGSPRLVAASRVSPGLLEELGARPVAGRLFRQDEARPGRLASRRPWSPAAGPGRCSSASRSLTL